MNKKKMQIRKQLNNNNNKNLINVTIIFTYFFNLL